MRKHNLTVYNSLSRQKEKFVPINDGFIGLYVCGPTVYSDVHLGNCRTFSSFDMIYRYLLHLGYKVRYVRNITDVGHLLDDGEDRMLKGARLEQLEPMEVAQKYTNGFHDVMRILNTKKPSIEPSASGHIPEQIRMVEEIIANGFAYEKNGSVYFDTRKFAEAKSYGTLSGRVIDELFSGTRDDLKNQSEKNHPSDFAIWMKASPEHIMKWESPWSVGFPGWHLECSVMSTKYLGQKFDIHGGGNDLIFPHHENEIAQNVGACGVEPANYWLHTNMLLMNGKKMSKSDGNTISPDELFSGESDHVSKGYHPTFVRFFMLQSHYRSTMDLTDSALQAAEKGYIRLMAGRKIMDELKIVSDQSELDVELLSYIDKAYAEMDDDFNTAKALAALFELVSKCFALYDGHLDQKGITENTKDTLIAAVDGLVFDVFGLEDISAGGGNQQDTLNQVMELILEMRAKARADKDWSTSDFIRDHLQKAKIVVKDGKEGATWSIQS